MFLGHKANQVLYSALFIITFFTSFQLAARNAKQTLKIALPKTDQPSADLIFDAIAKENLKTLTTLTEDRKISEENTGKTHKKWHEVLVDTLQRHLNLDAREKRRLIFMLFSSYEKEHPFSVNTVIDPVSWQDLELLCGPKSDPSYYVASKIDRTVTEAGRAIFFKKIIEPTTDTAVLANNQAIIKELLTNEKLFEKFEEELERFKKAENVLLSLWHEDAFHDAIKQDELNIPGAKRASAYINKSPVLVEMNTCTRLAAALSANAMMACSAILLPAAGIAHLKGKQLPNFPMNVPIADKEINLDFSKFSNMLHNGAQVSFFGLSFMALYALVKFQENTLRKIEGGENIFLGPLTGYPAMFFPDYMRYTKTLRICLQTKLIYIAQYVDSLKKIASLIKHSPELHNRCPELANLGNELAQMGKESKHMEQLLGLLEKNTFKGKASLLSWYGRINVAYQLIHSVKNQFIHPMMVVGELDAYLSCVRLIKEFNQKNIPICFPTYLQATEPEVVITGFWNPSIPGHKAITNSLTIGTKDHPKNIIVTGPNAGGKSTTMKGLLVNVVLAQTFGIATARSLAFTPFSKIITYLNITDDIAAGKSHFKAGACRAREVIQTVQSVQKGSFSLAAVDEVFNGTTFYEGQAAAYALIEQLSTYPQNICVTITHFPQVPNLEKEYPGMFANYKVTVSFSPEGQMLYPYKIQRGVSHQNIALEILKIEGFNDTFLTKATQILAQNPEAKELQ